MTACVAALRRHPIKSHGRQRVRSAELEVGGTFPWDRRWAVAHEKSEADGSAWAPPAAFSRCAKVPSLMAIEASVNEANGRIRLAHPKRPDLVFDPESDQDGFLAWVRPLMPVGRAAPVRLVRLEGRGMTDTDFPSISLVNLASNDAVGRLLGHGLSAERWRANIHVSGLAAWEEIHWIGRRLRIGEAELSVREAIVRCRATEANPDTGVRDADTLAAIEALSGRREFGVYAEVVAPGRISVSDPIELL